jgi:DNA-directed RNA polymerase subunit M/transcription elongation factor TFIIS
MATVIEIPCPDCDRILKVPESAFGKKLKCKHCGATVQVDDLDSLEEEERQAKKKSKKDKEEKESKPAVKASKPGGAVKPKKEKEEPKKEEKKPEEKKAEAYKFEDDEDSAKPNPLGVVDGGEDIPRCPHCAKELDPPDAKVCVHCGFNNVTRVKADFTKTWEPDTSDWINHLLPGILALLGCIGLIILVIVCWVNMRDWMTDTLLQKDDKSATGEVDFYVKPGAFIAFIVAATIMPIIGLGRFAVKRLILNPKPEERVKL